MRPPQHAHGLGQPVAVGQEGQKNSPDHPVFIQRDHKEDIRGFCPSGKETATVRTTIATSIASSGCVAWIRCAEPGGAAEPPVAAIFSVQFWLRPVCRWAIYGFASGSRTWLSVQREENGTTDLRGWEE